MAKIGRNEPCPCGSGKKYKKCCIDKVLETPRVTHWRLEEINVLSTEKIIAKLRDFGVEFDEDEFLKDVEHFHSACELADDWQDRYTITAVRFDVDFIWMACIELWRRLAPDVVNTEHLDALMQVGYELTDNEGEDLTEGCDVWLQVWGHLKDRFAGDMTSIHDAEAVFSGMRCLTNWCQDLEEALHKAGKNDPAYYHKRLEYCTEFCSLFPDSERLIIINMKRAAAECYFSLGRIDEGDRAFERMANELPNSVWPYIGWGDMYCVFTEPGVAADKEKAKRIYQMGLAIDSYEKRYLLERLESLDENQD